jgi:hypothetical protein
MIAVRYAALVGRVATFGATFGPPQIAHNPEMVRYDMPPTADARAFDFWRESYTQVAPDPDYWPRIWAKVASLDWQGFSREELASITAPNHGHPVTLTNYFDYYLSFDQRDHLERSCPTSASAGEIARQDKAVSERFADGFGQLVALIEAGLNTSPIEAERRQRALAIMATMMGGVAASRAVAKANPELSDEILLAVRQVVGQIGGEDLQVREARVKARRQTTKRQ